jgi:methylenetetrahydrofolate dehydrogenase (NADP+) / methenyltetrahydrofolate cyclohydrolase
MRIDGTVIAARLLKTLIPEIADLRQRGTHPTLGIIQVGNTTDSDAFIRQKRKSAQLLGIGIEHKTLGNSSTVGQLNGIIDTFNSSPEIHGVILQRPLPQQLTAAAGGIGQIAVGKDVDGFERNSRFPVPVASAVMLILQDIYEMEHPEATSSQNEGLMSTLLQKQVVVIGKGSTAGAPIAKQLAYHRANLTVLDSKSQQREALLKRADIIISCVGKPNIVRRDGIKKGSILISVGVWRDTNGKIHGDYDEQEVGDIASFYTPTPGGVGPVNVACLMANVVQAARK